MSTKYTGGFITKAPVAPTSSAASGIWTLDQQQQAQKAGTWPSPPIFIEDLFSTYLYTGNGSTQTITNGIDLSGQGGLTWIKDRFSTSGPYHALFDTARGAGNVISSNANDATNAYGSASTLLTSFGASGFSLGTDSYQWVNKNTNSYVSWTFREAPKFFDVVTWTGNGSARTIAHNLGSTPGCIIIKCLNTTFDWIVWHRSFPANNQNAFLNTTDPAAGYSVTSSTAPTDTVFSLTTSPYTNQNGSTYVAYLFAHNAGGFPVSGGGSTNGISCGSYTTDGSGNATINLGYEPQWLLQKSSDASGNWFIADVMRGMTVSSTDPANLLRPNLANAESTGSPISPTPTGFIVTNFVPSVTYIYIAIRRGPMKTPTTGTSVYGAETWTGTSGSPRTFTSANWTFPTDLVTVKATNTATWWNVWAARLTGGGTISTNSLGAELSASGSVAGYVSSFNQTGYTATIGTSSINNYNSGGDTYIGYNMRRAPSFFDMVCYTGTGAALSLTHNLTVAPELIFIKARSGSSYWILGGNFGASTYWYKNDWGANDSSTSSSYSGNLSFGAQPTSTTVTLDTNSAVNSSGSTYEMWMWATCPGVSKVGTYTGTGALQTIACGFAAGARFVLITRVGVVGDNSAYYWDSVRGISSSTDPYLLLNTSAAEVTGTNYVDTDTTGFKVTAAASSTVNVSGGTYIFLAIA